MAPPFNVCSEPNESKELHARKVGIRRTHCHTNLAARLTDRLHIMEPVALSLAGNGISRGSEGGRDAGDP